MNADKYLESIGLENVIDEEFFNNDDKSWYKVQELMESYHQAKLKLLDIPVAIQQRELLKNFLDWSDGKWLSTPRNQQYDEMFDEFFNCG